MKRKFALILCTALFLSGCDTVTDKDTTKNSNVVKESKEPVVTETPGEVVYQDTPTKDEKLLNGMYKGVYCPQNYKKFFSESYYSEYLHTDVSQWKDSKGNWCYPADYEKGYVLTDDIRLAKQQFPEKLLEEISTEDLLNLVMKKPGMIAYGISSVYDERLYALSLYRSDYNFIDALMSRSNCKEVVETCYSSYSKKEIEKYSSVSNEGYGETFEDENEIDAQEKFQLLEALKWYFMKQDGEKLPNEDRYYRGLEVE